MPTGVVPPEVANKPVSITPSLGIASADMENKKNKEKNTINNPIFFDISPPLYYR
jgi:hypothetical protein